MKPTTLGAAIVAILILTIALPAAAAAPGEGTVYEGMSVPGLALGDTRATADSSFGEPDQCRDYVWSDQTTEHDYQCRYPADGGGTVTVRFDGADGGPSQGVPTDVVTGISWNQYVTGWTTSAGINSSLALENPDAAIAAYPGAEVLYNPVLGNIEHIFAPKYGITIDYQLIIYQGRLIVDISIYEPYEYVPPPPPEQVVTVEDINLSATKVKGNRTVTGFVLVRDQTGYGAEEAIVTATWTFPDGTTRQVIDDTTADGWAWFQLTGVKGGYYTLTVDDVTLDGHR
ncbi:MAG: hypothetical protein OEY55_11090, partial [Acidimicrobiia bacterium]|nr:hypothetical protein [Acidimicrobiia bacterium]